jgi:curli biogenesis system outer membrane secretion channel CsgG
VSRRAWRIAALALLCGCATNLQVAVNPKADFSAVRRVAVVSFGGPQGDSAADAMTQYLVAYGADVVERQRLQAVLGEQQLGASGALDPATVKRVGKVLGVDALVIGTVSDLTPSRSYVVQNGSVVVGSVTPIEGRNVYAVGGVPGSPDSQVIASAATVGLTARMVDVETGSILWSAMMNYEGFDTSSAMRSIAQSMVASLVPVWPSLIKPKA